MDDNQEKLLGTVAITAIIGYGAYLLIGKPLLSLLGADPADKEAITNQEQVPPSDNPFSFQYQGLQDTLDSAGTDIASFVNQSQSLLAQAPDPGSIMIGPFSGAVDAGLTAYLASKIYNAFGFWHFVGDYDAVNDAFDLMPSKPEVAAVSAYMQLVYNTDLWNFLKNGAGLSFRGMHPSDLAAIVNKVNALPDN